MLMYGRNQHNIVIILQLKINKKKKKRVHMPQLKIPHAPTKIKDPMCLNEDPVQTNKCLKKKKLINRNIN